MNTNTNSQLSDQEMMVDALSSQKFITGNYNTFSGECSGDSLRSKMLDILEEEHNIQNDIFQEMQKRGWYQVQNAQQSKIDETKQKYMNQNAQ